MSTIIDFSQERIVVLVKNKKVAINGKKLSLITMNDQRISIEGIIKSLEYISDEKISS
jgi:sporulation protein YqfC